MASSLKVQIKRLREILSPDGENVTNLYELKYKEKPDENAVKQVLGEPVPETLHQRQEHEICVLLLEHASMMQELTLKTLREIDIISKAETLTQLRNYLKKKGENNG